VFYRVMIELFEKHNQGSAPLGPHTADSK